MNHIPPLRDIDDPGFDPYAAHELAYGDADDATTKLRDIAQHGRVQEGDLRVLVGMAPDMTAPGQRYFAAFGYEEVREVLSNPEVWSIDHYKVGLGQTFGSHSLSALNAPDHTRYRRIFQKAFLPHVVASWSNEFIEPVINALMDRVEPQGRCDIMRAFVEPYPFEIIYKQLRLPADEAKIFYRLTLALIVYMVDVAHGREAHDKLGSYFRAVIKERRRNPGTDLVSVLATTEVDGEYLPDEALLSFFRQLLIAAADTTFRSTGNMLVGLLSERPDQFEMIKKDRTLIAKAIEETLRWDGPITVIFRTATRDTVLGGVNIPKGCVVQCILGLANRDPEIYPNPGRFDMMRAMPRTHMGFAAGPHICLGQHLARLEMTRAMNILLDRLPKLRLDPDYPKPEVRGWSLRCPREIRVRFD
jgi:cytochrome P450